MDKAYYTKSWLKNMEKVLAKTKKELENKEDKEFWLNLHQNQLNLLDGWLSRDNLDSEVREELEERKKGIKRELKYYDKDLEYLRNLVKVDEFTVNELKNELERLNAK